LGRGFPALQLRYSWPDLAPSGKGYPEAYRNYGHQKVPQESAEARVRLSPFSQFLPQTTLRDCRARAVEISIILSNDKAALLICISGQKQTFD
jgi:hypothetical protein